MPHGVYEPGITSGIRDVASIRRTLERFVVRSAETIHVFYASEAALPAQIAAVDKVDAIVFPNGAPTPDRTENWVGGGGYFLWMGRYDPSHKGLDNLLRQWAALARARPPLVLAGPDYKDGRARTAQLVEELGISGDVTLLDDMRDKEKDTLMRRCSAYLHPSRWESCSIMLLEMLSAGVPTVVSSTIHAAEPLSSAGVAVAHDFSSDADLGLTLSMVRDNHHLGRAASAWVESLATWDRIGERYGGWLDKVSKGAC
jgi:glycosyltransferase involved in cell wall biosynthesis